jgi:hypothetical protein
VGARVVGTPVGGAVGGAVGGSEVGLCVGGRVAADGLSVSAGVGVTCRTPAQGL